EAGQLEAALQLFARERDLDRAIHAATEKLLDLVSDIGELALAAVADLAETIDEDDEITKDVGEGHVGVSSSMIAICGKGRQFGLCGERRGAELAQHVLDQDVVIDGVAPRAELQVFQRRGWLEVELDTEDALRQLALCVERRIDPGVPAEDR